MYAELIKRLTACEDDCSRCPMMYDEQVEQDLVREHCAAYEAADAIERLADENTRLVTTANGLSKMYDELVDEMPDGWIPVTERLPDKVGMYLVYVHAYNNVKNEPFFQELGCDGSYIDYLEFDDRQKVWQNGQYDAYNAVLSAVDKDNSYYISHWMMPPKKPEEPPVMFYPQVDGITPTVITPKEES